VTVEESAKRMDAQQAGSFFYWGHKMSNSSTLTPNRRATWRQRLSAVNAEYAGRESKDLSRQIVRQGGGGAAAAPCAQTRSADVNVSTDELCAMLTDAGLRAWRMDQNSGGFWHVVLAGDSKEPLTFYRGDGATVGEALTAALGEAGFCVTDDDS
jgi:hypothetical protein